MMFQSLLIEIGITGWMLSTFCVPFSGPKLRFVLFWNGTLIRLPTGFCASLASSSADISARAGVTANAAPISTKSANQVHVVLCIVISPIVRENRAIRWVSILPQAARSNPVRHRRAP